MPLSFIESRIVQLQQFIQNNGFRWIFISFEKNRPFHIVFIAKPQMPFRFDP